MESPSDVRRKSLNLLDRLPTRKSIQGKSTQINDSFARIENPRVGGSIPPQATSIASP
jgi:hypothetical protein